jgi:hypothetical protein
MYSLEHEHEVRGMFAAETLERSRDLPAIPRVADSTSNLAGQVARRAILREEPSEIEEVGLHSKFPERR